jgi:hypothetical protein
MSVPRRPGHDVNGMPLTAALSLFSEEEIAAARRGARLQGHRHDLVGVDPAGLGWRFLREARVYLGGKDPGRAYFARPAARQTRAKGNFAFELAAHEDAMIRMITPRAGAVAHPHRLLPTAQAIANGAGLGLALLAGLAFGCHDDRLALILAALSSAPVILFLAWRA